MTTFKGLIFDFKRFAVHDGQGIRTTVFLKGCPLRCAWCQNPEGLSSQPQILYMESNCIHCKNCVHASKHGGVTSLGDRILVHRDVEDAWDRIVDACPTTAMRFDSKVYTLAEAMAEIRKDVPFFKYGGGLTISGGEPFMQTDFLCALLKAAKKEGIHTAIETTLYTSLENIKRVLPYIDQWYCDCKCLDDDLHQSYTKVHVTPILENIRFLLQSECKDKVIIRTPLIPEMTGTKDTVCRIASFLVSCYEGVHYELLNYNPLAKSKYDYLDMEYCFEKNPTLYTNEEMNVFYDIARDSGIKHLIIE